MAGVGPALACARSLTAFPICASGRIPMSLLREIQQSLMQEKSPIGPVLLKLRFLASRLGSDVLEEWIKYESEGYPSSSEVPDYRKLLEPTRKRVERLQLVVVPFGLHAEWSRQCPGLKPLDGSIGGNARVMQATCWIGNGR
ncbi:hypothetical protein [Amaricoccus sp. B4]|uniref:AbiTii domain-containing protein n=1 Tax=Amaricoccus sp. B4 TaxID=3368557 RepID=UPI0037233C0A